MHTKNSDIIFAVGTLFLGGIIGALIENQINSGVKASYLAILVLSITLFVVIAIIKSSLTDQVTNEKNTLQAIKNIDKSLGLKVAYQELKKIGQGAGDNEDLLANLMRNADFEILEIGRGEVHEREENPDLAAPAIRQEYYDSIIKRVETQVAKGTRFVYKRIYQTPLAGGNLHSLGDKIFVNHCKQMLMLNKDNGIQAYVKRTRLTFPIAFLIIDRQHLVISIDAFHHKENSIQRYMKGELIISDPKQELIKVFLTEWEQIENSPYTQTISLDEFNVG